MIFAAVNVAAVRLADRTGGRRWISAVGAAACSGATVALLVHTAQTSPGDLALVAVMLVVTYAGEATYQSRRRAPARVPGAALTGGRPDRPPAAVATSACDLGPSRPARAADSIVRWCAGASRQWP